MSDVTLPKGWRATQLGEVVEYGKTQKCGLSDITVDTWILELEDIEKISSRIIQRLNTSERPFKSTKNKFKKGDVLYGKLRPYLNKVVIADDNGVCSTEIIPLDAEPNVNNHYLFHWLKSEAFLNYVVEVSYGVNMPRLGTKDGLLAPFVLPPLAEQKVIADKLDTLLAKVETTKARLDCIPQILKTFRQSVLAAAVSGKLTEEWREVTKAKVWTNEKLGDVIGDISQGWSPKCLNEVTVDESWGVIKTSSVQKILFVEEENKKLPENLKVRQHLKVEVGDILTTRAGPRSRCGITCYVKSISLNLMICDKVYRYRVRPQFGLNKFLVMQLNSSSALEKIETLKTGISESGMNLTQKKFKELPLLWPSLEEQTEIVCRVEELFTFADSIEQKANVALARVNNITQSILAKAFRGELTAGWRAANPELISDEKSAEALLAKIKAEREVLKKQPKKKTAVRKKT
ncbi:MAG: type I restriction enzyme S subunit [Arenicella sp.]|jgi:type I restriction enzyme S subunit